MMDRTPLSERERCLSNVKHEAAMMTILAALNKAD
jgi:hypothetical protein